MLSAMIEFDGTEEFGRAREPDSEFRALEVRRDSVAQPTSVYVSAPLARSRVPAP